jgi:general secretion pathway protein A
MYEDFFGLNSSPFQLSPDPFFMIPSERSKEALSSISDAIRLRKGFIVMTGEVGTGKTLVLRCLIESLEREEISFAYFIGPRLSTVDFLSYIASELGLDVTEQTKGNLLRALYVFLLAQFEKGLTTVLIIDEAHQMPRSVLEEIRLLTNFETAQQKLVQIVLVGQPELDKKLDLAELRSLKQRIAVRCQLEPLGDEAIRHYIERRLELAGAGSEAATIFPAETIKAIYRYSQGIPRLVNSICDQALAAACTRQMRVVPVEVIKAVASQFRLEPAKQTEKPLAHAAQAEISAPEGLVPAGLPSNMPAIQVRELETTAALLGESTVMPVPIPMPTALTIMPETLHQGGLRDVSTSHTHKLEPKNIVVNDTVNDTPAPAPTHEPVPAVASPLHARRATPSESFQRQSVLSASGLRATSQPDKDFHDAWPSQIRRWLKPGLRLSLIIGAAAVVPAALATGVYMARHQKTPVTVPNQIVNSKEVPSLRQAATPVAAAGADPAMEVAVGPMEGLVPRADTDRLIPSGNPAPLVPRAKAAVAASAKPVHEPHFLPPSAEPPPVMGAQTKDSEIGSVLLGNSLPSPAPPAASVGSTPPASLGMQTKEPELGNALLETSPAGAASPVANIGRHFEGPRLISSPAPTYPSVARTSNMGGSVLIDAVVDESGRVTDMKAISGNPILRKAAMDGLRLWKYEPARLNGQPTSARIQVRINFSLH